jgi:hypothetical protein
MILKEIGKEVTIPFHLHEVHAGHSKMRHMMLGSGESNHQ